MQICWPNNPSSLIPLEACLQKMHLEIAVPTTQCHPKGPQAARSIIGIGETKGLNHLGSLHLPPIVGLKVTGVRYRQHLRYHPDLTSQMDQDVPGEVDDIERKPM